MDGTTIVSGRLSHVGDADYLTADSSSSPKKYQPTTFKNARDKNFVETADYLATERPFFVAIGKDGLIAALQKLDAQLRQVRAPHSYSV